MPDDVDPDVRQRRRQRLLMLALAANLLVIAVAVGVTAWYIAEIRKVRDQQLQIIREEIRVGNCDLLDQFPAGGLLDRPRAKYGCGPGYPASEIDPRQREQQADILAPRSPAPPTSELVIPDGPRVMESSP